MTWSINIKVVGNLPSPPLESHLSQEDIDSLSDFTIYVDPTDSLQVLHSKIKEITGLEVEQQRLIYKGRLLTAPSSPSSPSTRNPSEQMSSSDHLSLKICDVSGLEDGHTIHLMSRQRQLPTNNNISLPQETSNVNVDIENENEEQSGDGTDGNDRQTISGGITPGFGGLGLLSALLSLDRDQDSDNEPDPLEALFSMPSRRQRSNRRRRPNAHRRQGALQQVVGWQGHGGRQADPGDQDPRREVGAARHKEHVLRPHNAMLGRHCPALDQRQQLLLDSLALVLE